MPELPEVENIKRGVKKISLNKNISQIKFYRDSLRTKIPIKTVKKVLLNKKVLDVKRRSKYFYIETDLGLTIFHLGMSGTMLCLPQKTPQFNHTHAVFTVKDSITNKLTYLHYVDPRRFGIITAQEGHNLSLNKLFMHLGPEPLLHKNLGEHLFKKSRNKKQNIKTFIMDAKNVVGVGNIYACESLYATKIDPTHEAGAITLARYNLLSTKIIHILKQSIKAGGTTLKDFQNVSGEPGYHSLALKVYGKKNETCKKCHNNIIQIKQTGRSTWYCATCQK